MAQFLEGIGVSKKKCLDFGRDPDCLPKRVSSCVSSFIFATWQHYSRCLRCAIYSRFFFFYKFMATSEFYKTDGYRVRRIREEFRALTKVL